MLQRPFPGARDKERRRVNGEKWPDLTWGGTRARPGHVAVPGDRRIPLETEEAIKNRWGFILCPWCGLFFCQISGGMISKREFKAGLLICLRGLKSLYKHFFSQVSFYPWEEMDFQTPRDLLSAKQVSQLS